MYTSGTTGHPKGVVRTVPSDAQREAIRAKLASIFGVGDDERTLIPAPLYHSAPNGYAHAAAVRGMDMTLMERFDAEQFLALVAEHRVTVVQMVPTMFVRLLALPEHVRARYDLSSLRWIVHGAAPCAPDVKRAMIDWLGLDRDRVLRNYRDRSDHVLHEPGVARSAPAPSGDRSTGPW